MSFFTKLDNITLYGYIGILFSSLLIGLIFLFLHFWWQKKFYQKKKSWNFNDNTFLKILDWLKRNIFSLFAFIFLFSAIAIVLFIITNTVF